MRSRLGRPPDEDVEARRRWSVLRRRKWLIVQAVVLVPAVAVGYSVSRDAVYRGTAHVLLRTTTLAAATEEARAAKDPTLLATVVSGQPQHMTAGAFAQHATVDIARTNILNFTVESGKAGDADSLATLWAYRFSIRRRSEYRTALRARIPVLRRTLTAAEARPKIAQVRRILADLTISPAAVVGAAKGADQVTPRPLRAGLMGLLFGVVLGTLLALVAEARSSRRPVGEPGSG
jgi:uncharacterized protein involved in exopolysaccharide biosynthesis